MDEVYFHLLLLVHENCVITSNNSAIFGLFAEVAEDYLSVAE